MRYRFLEILHQYASETLLRQGEARVVCERHVSFLLQLFEQAAHEMPAGADREWLVRLEPERDNLDSALHWLVEQGDLESARRLAAAAHRFWFYGGHVTEGRRWLERLVAMSHCPGESHDEQSSRCSCGILTSAGGPDGQSPSTYADAQRSSVRAKLFFSLGQIAMTQGDVLVGEHALRHSLEIYQWSGDNLGAAWTLQCLGQLAQYRGNFLEARSLLESAVVTSRGNAYRQVLAAALSRLAEVAREQGHNAEAQTQADEAWKIAKTTGSTGQLCEAANILGALYEDSGIRAMAQSVWQEALTRPVNPNRRST